MSERIKGNKIPQSSRLSAVRTVIESVDRRFGSPEPIGLDTGISIRHVIYHLNAAEILGLVIGKNGRFRVTRSGEALLATTQDSEEERALYGKALAGSEFTKELFPDLLSTSSLVAGEIAKTLEKRTSLSGSTARRRASTIVTWVKTIRGESLRAKAGDPPKASSDTSKSDEAKKTAKAIEEFRNFVNDNPFASVATVEDGEPRVRVFMRVKWDEKGLLFNTGMGKDVQQQLSANQSVELVFYSSKTNEMVRIRGRAEFSESREVKEEVLEIFTFLKPAVEKMGDNILCPFYIKDARATHWSFEKNMEPKKWVNLDL